MGIIPPNKSSDRTVTLKHWQRVWVDRHSTINFSGLIQELLVEIIKVHDPKYYNQYKHCLDISQTRKKEIIDRMVKTTPVISNMG